MPLLNHLISAIRSANRHNPDIEVPPACVLWPDQDRQWEAAMALLKEQMPELLCLGGYDPENRTGPAIWLRCALARTLNDNELPPEVVPILYLPGVGRHQLRAVEECPDDLKPLAELQFRGALWTQLNNKDWTLAAFLKSEQGGLGLEVAQDTQTRHAMQLSLGKWLQEDLDLLRGKYLDLDYFNTLLTGGDPVRDILNWINEPEAYKKQGSPAAWEAFVSVTKSKMGIHPENDGPLKAATRLAEGNGPWKAVWERYCEAPGLYPFIPDQIRKCDPPTDMFYHMGGATFEGWPQWHEGQEAELRLDLKALGDCSSAEARKKVLALEKKHAQRRKTVWARLGIIPCAMALEPLAQIARITGKALGGGNLEDVMTGYRHEAWQADWATIEATSVSHRVEVQECLVPAIQTLYRDWLDEGAKHFQALVRRDGYPLSPDELMKTPSYREGDCVLFVDGLRFDCAQWLKAELQKVGLEVTSSHRWSALPSVTATGKAAVSPVRSLITGKVGSYDFEPEERETGSSLKGGSVLKKLLKKAGWQVLEKSESGDPAGKAWVEFGNIDHEGHDRGKMLALHLKHLLTEVRERIQTLMASGWKRIHVVTDHGWLFLPGSLPKVELPSFLTESKWSRCSALKEGAICDEKTYPWSWCEDQHFALPTGIRCFKRGDEYAHGGLSLQECFLEELWIQGSSGKSSVSLDEVEIKWKGMRCKVSVKGQFDGLRADLRLKAADPKSSVLGDPKSSVLGDPKSLNKDGSTSLVVEKENLEGTAAFLVFLDEGGDLVAQRMTSIGGT